MTNKYNTFNDIENETLRTWNRCSVMINIMTEHGKERMKEYAMQFSQEERALCWAMFKNVQDNGYEKIRSYVNRVVQQDRVVH